MLRPRPAAFSLSANINVEQHTFSLLASCVYSSGTNACCPIQKNLPKKVSRRHTYVPSLHSSQYAYYTSYIRTLFVWRMDTQLSRQLSRSPCVGMPAAGEGHITNLIFSLHIEPFLSLRECRNNSCTSTVPSRP